ncbi:MAG: hypothetical protein PVG65_04245 [Candidatus Thorarchaeota archaeon]|jgi:hypothetical protein
MEKDIGKIKKNDTTDIVVRVDDFGGRIGVTVREFVNGADGGYSGFTKAGTRIPADKFLEFRELVNAIDIKDLEAGVQGEPEKPAEEKPSE